MDDVKLKRLYKCNLAKIRGYIYDEVSGKITTPKGNIVNRKVNGYVFFSLRIGKERLNLYAHHYAWFSKNGEVVDFIDHINCVRSDNRIVNLRSVTNQENHFNNSKSKGYCFDQSRNKYLASIKLNGKMINLGRFNTELEARNAYLKAKKIHHIIK